MMEPHTWQVENFAGLHSALKRPRAIEVQGKLGNLIIQGLSRRVRIHTAPRHISSWLLKLQIKLSSIPRIFVGCSRVITNVQSMNISGWQQQEVLLSSDNSVEILIVILVEGGLRLLCTNPEVNSFRLGAESFGGPTDMGVTVTGEGRVFRAKAIVLLLGVGHKLGGVGGGDEVEGVGEGHVLHVSRGEAWEIHLWSENQSATVLVRHKGPVRGLEFHTTEPNLLASGAEDGQICIWDLANALEPKDSASQGEISFLSWNSQVQHILASTSYDGTMVVWDTKNLKQVISFADSVRRRCSILQWNPDIPTQLIIASEDDSPLRLWDLRFTMAPIMEFVGHTRGVIGMTWCPNDGASLLTCGKDSRTICWNTISGEGGGQIAYELPTGTRWNFDVHWCPETPGVISASSFDGRIDGVISVCSFEGKIGMYKIKAAGDGADDDDNGDDGDSGIDGTRAADVYHDGNIDGVDYDDGDNGIDGTSTADVCHVGEVSVSSRGGNWHAADGNNEDETSGTGSGEESYLEGTEEDDEEESEEDDEEESEESGSSSEGSFRQFSDDDIEMDGTEDDDEEYFDDEYNPRRPLYYDDEYRAPGPVSVAFGHPAADSEEDEDVEEYDFDAGVGADDDDADGAS